MINTVLREFRWLSAGPIPAACDLRAAGWTLLADGAWIEDRAARVLLAVPALLSLSDWLALTRGPALLRQRAVLLAVPRTQERSRLLRAGFGDVLDDTATLAEIEARAVRVMQARDAMPRRCRIGPLTLDLFDREAHCHGRRLGLHPREFALLWRLAEIPGEAVSQDSLLRDVWRLSFRPETNSLAVHVSRLRTKLRSVGLDWLVETLASGAYRLAPDRASPLILRERGEAELPLDEHVRLGKVAVEDGRDRADATGIEA